jgi:hypothetical protein
LAHVEIPGHAAVRRTGLRPAHTLGRIDHSGDNWWCAGSPEPTQSTITGQGSVLQLPEPLHALYSTGAASTQFLSVTQKNRAREEWLELSKAPAAADYLAAQTVEWARSHCDDPRVPEALHLAVQATRYGCGVAKQSGIPSGHCSFCTRIIQTRMAFKTKYFTDFINPRSQR